MKNVVLGLAAAAALTAAPAYAGDTHLSFGFYSPAPVVYHPAPVAYYPPVVRYTPYSYVYYQPTYRHGHHHRHKHFARDHGRRDYAWDDHRDRGRGGRH